MSNATTHYSLRTLIIRVESIFAETLDGWRFYLLVMYARFLDRHGCSSVNKIVRKIIRLASKCGFYQYLKVISGKTSFIKMFAYFLTYYCTILGAFYIEFGLEGATWLLSPDRTRMIPTVFVMGLIGFGMIYAFISSIITDVTETKGVIVLLVGLCFNIFFAYAVYLAGAASFLIYIMAGGASISWSIFENWFAHPGFLADKAGYLAIGHQGNSMNYAEALKSEFVFAIIFAAAPLIKSLRKLMII